MSSQQQVHPLPSDPGISSYAELMAGNRWIHLNIPLPAIVRDQGISPAVGTLPKQELYSFQGFKISGLGSNEIISSPIEAAELPNDRKAREKLPRIERGSSREVLFLKLDPIFREEILRREVTLLPTEGILPENLAKILKKIGIGEERFVRVLNLSPTGRYTSEQNKFHSFCIPEHCIVNPDLQTFNHNPNGVTKSIFKTHMVYVVYNSAYTLIIHDNESPSVTQLTQNLADGRLEYFKRDDALPDMTTLLKDIIEANTISCQRVLRLFHKFKVQPFRAQDTMISAAFKMVLAELQNYWITQESPQSGVDHLLQGIRKDSAHLGCLLRKESRFQELLDQTRLATDRAQHLARGLQLRDDAQDKLVANRNQNISATLAALGSAFVPNATVSQLPINNPMISLGLHIVASYASFKLLSRMIQAGWFDFVTETFGDLFGMSKVFRFVNGQKKD